MGEMERSKDHETLGDGAASNPILVGVRIRAPEEWDESKTFLRTVTVIQALSSTTPWHCNERLDERRMMEYD